MLAPDDAVQRLLRGEARDGRLGRAGVAQRLARQLRLHLCGRKVVSESVYTCVGGEDGDASSCGLHLDLETDAAQLDRRGVAERDVAGEGLAQVDVSEALR